VPRLSNKVRRLGLGIPSQFLLRMCRETCNKVWFILFYRSSVDLEQYWGLEEADLSFIPSAVTNCNGIHEYRYGEDGEEFYLINHVNPILRARYNLDARESLYRPLEMRSAIDKSLAADLEKDAPAEILLIDKEVIVEIDVGSDAVESDEPAALMGERVEEQPRIRFNDPSTADLVVRVMPDGPLLSLNKSVVQSNRFFASFKNFEEANGYAEITAPDPESRSFVIEFLYHISTDECVVKFEEYIEWFGKRKLLGVIRNASYFMMDDLLSRCYLLYVSYLNLIFS
jgi:hypothetical protein